MPELAGEKTALRNSVDDITRFGVVIDPAVWMAVMVGWSDQGASRERYVEQCKKIFEDGLPGQVERPRGLSERLASSGNILLGRSAAVQDSVSGAGLDAKAKETQLQSQPVGVSPREQLDGERLLELVDLLHGSREHLGNILAALCNHFAAKHPGLKKVQVERKIREIAMQGYLVGPQVFADLRMESEFAELIQKRFRDRAGVGGVWPPRRLQEEKIVVCADKPRGREAAGEESMAGSHGCENSGSILKYFKSITNEEQSNTRPLPVESQSNTNGDLQKLTGAGLGRQPDKRPGLSAGRESMGREPTQLSGIMDPAPIQPTALPLAFQARLRLQEEAKEKPTRDRPYDTNVPTDSRHSQPSPARRPPDSVRQNQGHSMTHQQTSASRSFLDIIDLEELDHRNSSSNIYKPPMAEETEEAVIPTIKSLALTKPKQGQTVERDGVGKSQVFKERKISRVVTRLNPGGVTSSQNQSQPQQDSATGRGAKEDREGGHSNSRSNQMTLEEYGVGGKDKARGDRPMVAVKGSSLSRQVLAPPTSLRASLSRTDASLLLGRQIHAQQLSAAEAGGGKLRGRSGDASKEVFEGSTSELTEQNRGLPRRGLSSTRQVTQSEISGFMQRLT